MRQTERQLNIKRWSLVATGLIIVGLVGSWLVGIGNSGHITLDETIDVTDVSHVEVTTIAGRIEVMPIESSEARVISSGVPEDARLIVEVNDGMLTVETVWPRASLFNFAGFTDAFHLMNETPTLTVYLPMQIYEQIIINGTSGRIHVSDLTVNELQVNNLSGRIEVRDIEGNVTVDGTSGHIEIGHVTGDVNVQGRSGQITVANVTGDVRVRNLSGRINLSAIGGDIEGHNTSGAISLRNATVAQHVNLQGTSGRIEVILSSEPAHAQFNLSSTSGRTEIFGDRTTSARFGDGTYEVRLSTTSGRVSVSLE